MTEPEADQRLVMVGKRLRRLRHFRQLTLEQVSNDVDLSVSFLSMLERGQADISLTRFNRLALYYRISPNELLLEEGARGAPTIVSADKAPVVDRGPGVTYRLLCRDDHGVQAMLVTLEPEAGFHNMLAHKGHDFVWVITGKVVLLYGDAEYEVRKGEFVRYDATQPHAFRNPRRVPAELIGFTNAPYW